MQFLVVFAITTALLAAFSLLMTRLWDS